MAKTKSKDSTPTPQSTNVDIPNINVNTYDDVINDSFTLNQDLDKILREVGNKSDFDKIVSIEIIKKFK